MGPEPMEPNLFLYVALGFYASGTLAILGSLSRRRRNLQRIALGLMLAGFVSHTIFIGTICSRTGHPPITNLPETAAFISWVVFAVELVLQLRFKVRAVAFFVYPLVLLLLTVAAVVGETAVPLSSELDSRLFIAHLLFSSVGLAALLIALAFTLLYQIQEQALKEKRRGAWYDWIPSLRVCDLLSYRSLAIGFSIYTLGILAGVVWAYRTAAVASVGAKEIGAVFAWVMFAILLQSYLDGTFRTRRNLFVAAAAFISVVVSIFGIQRIGP